MIAQPKKNRWKSPKYIKWVKTLPCCISGKPADHAHHLIGMGNTSGMGLTAPDYFTIPLSAECHTKMHMFPDMQGDQWRYIAETLAKAIDEGVIK
jgi:hypothetical protein